MKWHEQFWKCNKSKFLVPYSVAKLYMYHWWRQRFAVSHSTCARLTNLHISRSANNLQWHSKYLHINTLYSTLNLKICSCLSRFHRKINDPLSRLMLLKTSINCCYSFFNLIIGNDLECLKSTTQYYFTTCACMYHVSCRRSCSSKPRSSKTIIHANPMDLKPQTFILLRVFLDPTSGDRQPTRTRWEGRITNTM
jgi:hypothetical protein